MFFAKSEALVALQKHVVVQCTWFLLYYFFPPDISYDNQYQLSTVVLLYFSLLLLILLLPSVKVLDTVLPALQVEATYPRWIKSTIKSTRNIQLHDSPHIPIDICSSQSPCSISLFRCSGPILSSLEAPSLSPFSLKHI